MPEPDAMVLVVDDDVSVREALEGLMRSAGLGVGTFASPIRPTGARAEMAQHPRQHRIAIALAAGLLASLLSAPVPAQSHPPAVRHHGLADGARSAAEFGECDLAGSPRLSLDWHIRGPGAL